MARHGNDGGCTGLTWGHLPDPASQVWAVGSIRFWKTVSQPLRRPALLGVLPQAIAGVWPKAVIQTCVVHLIRNCMRYASWKDRKTIGAALRPIYTAATVEAAELALEEFANSEIGRCPAAVAAWRRVWDEFVPFLDYPPAIRRVVYTTNAIESFTTSCGR
jgi:transposase-like protein